MSAYQSAYATLVAAVPEGGGRPRFRYTFARGDALALARVVAHRLAGQAYDERRARAVAWKALLAFARAMVRGGGGAGMSFRDFVRGRASSIPQLAWGAVPQAIRAIAAGAVTGGLPSPAPHLIQVRQFVGSGYGPTYGPGYVAPSYPPRYAGDYQTAYPAVYRTVYPRAHRGWRREAELEMEAPPPQGDAAPPPAPPPAPLAPPAPPPEANAPPPDASADADADAGADEPWMDDGAPAEPPPAWSTTDGSTLVLPSPLLRRLTNAWVRRPRAWGGRYSPWPGAPQAYAVRRPLVSRIARLARGARRIGTLRSRVSGRRYPVFGGRTAGKPFRIITRARGMRFEIMDVRHGALTPERAR